MLTTMRNLWFEKAASQYWQLIRVLFFNFKVVGYISVFFLCLACVSYVIGFIFPSFQMLGAPIAFLALFIFLFVGMIILPMGILGLVKNKHVYTIADMRNKLFVVVCCFCAVFSIITPLVLHSMKDENFLANSTFSIFLIGALYFWLTIYLMHKNLFLFGFGPLIVGGVAKLCASYLPILHPLVLPLVSVTTWAIFYRWWLAFRPARTRVKSIHVEFNPKKRRELPTEKWFYFSSSHVRTPMGSLLLGYGDGFLTIVKKLLAIYLTTFLFALFVCGGFKNGAFTENAFAAVLIALAYSFLILGIDFFSQRMLTNLKRGWLPFLGNRTEFFFYIERVFLQGLGFLVLFNISIICIFLWASEHVGYFLYCFVGLVIFSLILIWNFYLNIYFYSRNGFVVGEINYRKLIINLVIFIPPIVYLASKYQGLNSFGVWDGAAIGFVLLLISSLKMIRFQSIKYWRQADF